MDFDSKMLQMQELELKKFELHTLLEITNAINSNLSEEELYSILKYTLIAQFKLKDLTLYTLQEDQFEIQTSFVREAVTPLILPYELLSSIEKPEKLSLFPNINLPEKYNYVVPVIQNQKLCAALFLDARALEKEKLTGAIQLIQTLTNIIYVAAGNRILQKKQLLQKTYEKELELAANVQNMLLPKKQLENDTPKIDTLYIPHFSIGGDYYDYFDLENIFWFCIADISGKGMSAALLMANFQANFRALTRQQSSVKIVVESLNSIVFDHTNGERFITAFIGKFDRISLQLEYVNAGHNAPLYAHNKQITELEKGTTPLGAFPTLPFISIGQNLVEEETHLLLYTDGLTETQNSQGSFYGTDRLITQISKKAIHPVTDISNDLNVFKEEIEFNDDVTIMSIRF